MLDALTYETRELATWGKNQKNNIETSKNERGTAVWDKEILGQNITGENELVTFIAEHFQVSEKDAEEYINIWFELDNGKELESVLKLYGKTDAEIKKLLKWKTQ